MLNMNSPTVQAMLQNLPQGVGNMPVYFGNQPTVTEQTNPQFSTPYPSPKEMLMQSGQQNVYTPTSFTPRNIVGGYNPGYDMAFGGYVNPYMGYGTYSGYNPGAIINVPIDDDARERYTLAAINGLDYDEQLIMESELYKRMSRTVSKSLGRSEEEAKASEHLYDIYNKYPQNNMMEIRDPVKPLHIQIKVGAEVVADMPSREIGIYETPRIRSSEFVDNMRMRDTMIKNERIRRNAELHSSAVERQFDNVDLLDFFSNGIGCIAMEDLNMRLKYQNMSIVSQAYNREKYKNLLNNNGFKSKAQRKAIDRFVGRYGVMPDGRPVSPGHDPAVASSFSYNPVTGQYSVTAPNFIRDRFEAARESFIRSIE